ncbi:hypothetical protein [Paraburkholderia sp. Ac-20347]|uniref:hypothetical protein n=1 Tax=Paraburkholderia sp. Ac-20347 TaxID=2703892 RepID=UPI0019802FB4|nr:hypothetical protein [Paraburkholderia sp. Ac-20347]MBN3808819.1 hypothetical protein [Paraburkholderia sp. Ac-20347]
MPTLAALVAAMVPTTTGTRLVARGYSYFDEEQSNCYEESSGAAVRPYFRGVSMDIVRLENATGIASLMAAIGILIGVKMAKPYHLTTLLVGLSLIAFAVMSASTFSNYEVMAKLLNARHRLSDDALQEGLRVNNLWVLIYPALIGALGVNLLTSWLQSSKPVEDEDSIEMAVLRIISERSASVRDDARPDALSSRESSLRRPRESVRAMLVRRR